MQPNYKTATFLYDEDGPGLYTIMVTRFNGEGHEPLSHAGYRGRFHLFMHVDSTGVRDGYYDWRTMARKVAAADDETFPELLERIENGDLTLEEIDGRRFTEGSLGEIL